MAVPFFFKRTSNQRSDAVRQLKEHARAAINADEETVVTVIERDCADPGCGSARTVVLVMHPGRPTEAVEIEKPLEQVTQSDLFTAFALLAAHAEPAELPTKPA